ncbi:hypothetical protein C0992_008067, partial [Termitomyces sp. T32_za158]
MQRSSSPLSDRSYAEAVVGSPARRVQSLPTTPQVQGDPDGMQIDSPRASSPEIPLSSMPMISTQEQSIMEQNANEMGPTNIEVDNTLGRASEDVNALLQNSGVSEGWQMVTPRKNRKKAKKAAKKQNDSNKRPHSDSPIKERLPKRQATENGSEISGDEGDYRRQMSPSPALSVSALDYTDEEGDIREQERAKRMSDTPKAERKHTAARRATEARKAPPTARIFPERMGPPDLNPVEPPRGNPRTPMSGRRGDSPMKVSTPAQTPHIHTEDGDQVDPDENDPELWFETAEGDIITNGKGFRRTAMPHGGWPKVYLAANPAYNIAAETLNEWEEIPEPVIWARIYRAKYKHSEAGKTKVGDMVKHVIKNLVYVEHDESVAVIFPDQALPPSDNNRYPHPYHLLVVGLDPQQAQRLLDLEVVASSKATVFFLPRNPPRQLYILTMRGLTYNNTEGARELVEELAKKTFRASPEIRAMIENLSNVPTEEALDQILDIRASFLPVKQRIGITRLQASKEENENVHIQNPDFRERKRSDRTERTTPLYRVQGSDQTARGTQQAQQTSQTRTKTTPETKEHAQEGEATPDLGEDEAIEAEALDTLNKDGVALRYTTYFEPVRPKCPINFDPPCQTKSQEQNERTTI